MHYTYTDIFYIITGIDYTTDIPCNLFDLSTERQLYGLCHSSLSILASDHTIDVPRRSVP